MLSLLLPKFKNSPTPWQEGWKAIADRPWWQLSLIAIGSFSSIVWAHVPLVAFAAVAGSTATRQKALIVAASVWLANQIYGYGIRQYPQTFESIAWGLAMGVGALLVTGLAAIRPKFTARSAIAHFLWLEGTVIVGFGLYQGLIAIVGQFLGFHGLTLKILGQILVKDLVWANILGLAHLVFISVLRRSKIKTRGS